MEPAGDVVQVGIVCDCASIRQALGRILSEESWIERVVELDPDSGPGFAVAGSELRIDVLLLIGFCAQRANEETLKRLQGFTTWPKILLLALDDDNSLVMRALQAGALGVLSKGAQLDELLWAIRLVHSGQRYLSRPIQYAFANRYLRSRLRANVEESLTKRETEVLRLLALGENHHEIARQLFVSVKTVDTHRGNVLRKLKLRNNADLARYAIRNGLIDVAGRD